MNTNNFNQIALNWFKAFNDKNIDDLLALYDDDAIHYSPKLKVHKPETNGLIKGKIQLRAWWEDAFTRLPFLHYSILKIMHDDEQIFMEYIRQNKGEEDLRVGEVLVINKGKIIKLL